MGKGKACAHILDRSEYPAVAVDEPGAAPDGAEFARGMLGIELDAVQEDGEMVGAEDGG